MKQKALTAAEIWTKYERARDRMASACVFDRADICHRMYEGDQWYGIEKDGENLPKLNFIKPVVNYKTAMVARNDLSILYSPMTEGAANPEYQKACELMSSHASTQWERLKMAARTWDVVKDAAITGYAVVYFAGNGDEVQILDGSNVLLGDDTIDDLQKQPYIIVYERRPVEDVRDDARKAGVSEDDIAGIVSDDADNDPDDSADDSNRPTDEQKCTCLLYFRKVDGTVSVTRSTRTVIYAPETVQAADGGTYNDPRDTETYNKPRPEVGLKLYPLAAYSWARKRKRARGVGEVWGLVPNQIEINRTLVRRSISNQQTGYPKIVYQEGAITNPQDLTKTGAAIGVKNLNANSLNEIFTYMSPMPMASDAQVLQRELIDISRDLAGAGEAAMGQVNPERASGAAIIAVQDQAAIPLNEQSAAFKQFVEDIASIWFAQWSVWHSGGLNVVIDGDTGETVEQVSREVLEKLRVSVRIDVSPANPYSKFAREQSLENALAAKYIEFAEYVDALDDDATAPKAKFKQILAARERITTEQAAAQPPAMTAMPQLGGGEPGAMPTGGSADVASPELAMPNALTLGGG